MNNTRHHHTNISEVRTNIKVMSSTNKPDATSKCTCETHESDCCASSEVSPTSKDKKTRISFQSLGLNLKRGRSLHFKTKRPKKNYEAPSSTSSCQGSSSGIKKSPLWGLKFGCARKEAKIPTNDNQSCCKCTCYRRTDEYQLGAVRQNEERTKISDHNAGSSGPEVNEDLEAIAHNHVEANNDQSEEVRLEKNDSLDVQNRHIFNCSQRFRVIQEDCDEAARIQRAREIEQGVEAPANFRPVRRVQLLCSDVDVDGQAPRRLQLFCPPDLTVDSLLSSLFQNHVTLRSCPIDAIAGCHTQVDFIHCLVPDLLDITNCSFYWGKMDRYEAERLLDGKPEGTFLLRDSAQEEFLFSVSFRKYGRSLHARIEQWNHKFSFDSHDPGVYTSNTVCGLIEHYKDPSSCMFFEPMLTWPLHRNFVFSLQHLCRASIVSRLTYDNVNQLQLPKSLKSYLKEYHYRQKVRVEQFDDDVQWLDLRNVSP